uniref:Uncharacterized protein n=1 Tax=Arundo donax TaxID=35708 RepID=A0A0A9H9X9_ARUDO
MQAATNSQFTYVIVVTSVWVLYTSLILTISIHKIIQAGPSSA